MELLISELLAGSEARINLRKIYLNDVKSLWSNANRKQV